MNLLPTDVESELRIVLLGKVGVGKSASGNTILGTEVVFPLSDDLCSVTKKCKKEERSIDNQNVVVVDTPGLCHTSRPNKEVVAELKRSIKLTKPGPHVFLLVLRLGDIFTSEEIEMLKIIYSTFGKHTKAYTMILITKEDNCSKEEIKGYIDSNTDLLNLVEESKGGYHVFENKEYTKPNQVPELLKKIKEMVQTAGGCYTAEMLKEAEEELREQQERDAGKGGKETVLKIPTLSGILVGCVTGYFTGGGEMPSAIRAAVGGVVGATLGAVVGGLLSYAKACSCRKTNRGDW